MERHFKSPNKHKRKKNKVLNGEHNRINVYFNVNDECNQRACNSQPETMI